MEFSDLPFSIIFCRPANKQEETGYYQLMFVVSLFLYVFLSSLEGGCYFFNFLSGKRDGGVIVFLFV
jgi:hypothetical protein